MGLFRVKICGITNPEDAQAAAAAGADAIGLNFYAQSKRCVNDQTAVRIAAELPQTVAKVGVFVNADVQRIGDIHEKVGFDYVQLHGRESPDSIAEIVKRINGVKLIRAWNWQRAAGDALCDYLKACQQLHVSFAALLIDAYQPGQFGGTGTTVDWRELWPRPNPLATLPLILAGGLTSDNVAEAIRLVQPHGVDTAGGVESSPGIKSHQRCIDFVTAARQAFARLA